MFKTENKELFTDVFQRNAGENVYCYRSGLTVYEERLKDGVLIPGGWNAAGYPLNVLSNYPSYVNVDWNQEPSVFHLELDGETVEYGLEIKDFRVVDTLEGWKEAILSLTSTVKPVEIRLHTLLDGTAMFTRWLEVVNLSGVEMAVSALSVFSGTLEWLEDFRYYNGEVCPEDIYSLGYFYKSLQNEEGHFTWQKLGFERTGIAGRFQRARHRHPAFFLKNELTGMLFFGQLGWSAGYEFLFDYYAEHESKSTSLSLDMKVTGYHPLRVIAPGETYVSPQAHVGAIFGDLDDAVNASNEHIRRSVLNWPEADGKACLVGSGMGPEHDMSLETTKRFADQMAELGAEVFIVDAGWNCAPDKEGDWWELAGNWHADEGRYPNGISEIRDYIHSKGMKFGLWMEVERLGAKSDCFKEHPEWRTKIPFGNREQGFLDFTNPEAAAWAEEEIARVITEYKLDLFRVDYNVASNAYFYRRDRSAEGAVKCTEYGALKHFEAVYAMYGRLKKRFPDVIFENCAGGGGRTDLGLLPAFHHTWVSDNQRAPRSLFITSGMTLVLPPERVDRLVAGMGCHSYGSLDVHMRNAMLGHLTLNVLSPAAADWNPVQMEFIRHSVEVYKEFIRPMLPQASIYHFHPEVAVALKQGWHGQQLVAADKSKAAITLFRLPGAGDGKISLIPKGLDADKNYRVTFDNTGSSYVVKGGELMHRGIETMSLGAMTSELVLLESV